MEHDSKKTPRRIFKIKHLVAHEDSLMSSRSKQKGLSNLIKRHKSLLQWNENKKTKSGRLENIKSSKQFKKHLTAILMAN
ncbi:CLUMA_CG005141, isoform A [Clunio marinus]|uniref:CLUMA_CG005141, isoform A n=1 Tax=Clunio marinus TaxID=568069 RepID=A0A1J1HV98_9DIPT|nr:CLUMA_CG005141, isoform A [Clunio marinus]